MQSNEDETAAVVVAVVRTNHFLLSSGEEEKEDEKLLELQKLFSKKLNMPIELAKRVAPVAFTSRPF